MKRPKVLQKCIGFLLVSMLVCMHTMNLSAKVMSHAIELEEDKWDEGRRSITRVIPVTASIDGTLLTIQCSTGRSDITVGITGKDGFSYKEMYPSLEAYFINIDLANAPQGSYTLELTNQWGDYLTGVFEIQ